MDKLNTIYIISKGRPQCLTAQTLEKLEYPGEWLIVCGNNDETLPAYQKRWRWRVRVFDWRDEITRTDAMDNFGFEDKESGVTPARNAVRKISLSRGESRFWLFDDDYAGFSKYNPASNKNEQIRDGRILYDAMRKIAEFGYTAHMANIGFSIAGPESHPGAALRPSYRVFNAHNLPTEENLFVPFAGRLNEDVVAAVNVWRLGGYEISVRFLQVHMRATQAHPGGLTGLYLEDGTARKTAYAILAAPSAARLVYRFGRYHHSVAWGKLRPKLLDEKWRRESAPPPAPPELTPSPAKSALADKWRKALL